MAPPRKSVLPKALPEGFILTDTGQKKWRLGKIIGQGGFGLIYLASQNVSRPVAADTDFVIKLEYQENGPLFSELKFYQRAAKPESVQKWIRSKALDFLGIPMYWGSGLAEYNNLRYRFMAMDRLGTDLQKICDSNAGRLKKDTALQLGQRLVDVLEYIHENEYVHADIKAANLMEGYRDPAKIYLADYGLSYRYCPDGAHKEYKENPKKGHNGTIEYTSLDAHKGTAPSRRGDLQILGFCLLHWLSGSLPWDGFLTNPAQVQEAKTRLMDNLPDSVLQLSVSRASTDEVAAFLLYVKTLQYQERPDYQHLKDLLASVDGGRLDFSMPATPAAGPSKELDPGSRAKKAGRAKAASKAKHMAPVLDEDVPEGRRCKPAHQQEEVLPAVRRSLRPRPDVAHTSADVSEDEARPRPIPACYIRGPPRSPRTQNKQNTEYNKGIFRKGDSPTATSKPQEQRLHPHWRPHRSLECDSQSQTRWGCRECWDERLHSHRAYCNCHWCWGGNLWYEHRERSALTDAGREAGPTQREQVLHWWVFVGGSFVLGVWALGVF